MDFSETGEKKKMMILRKLKRREFIKVTVNILRKSWQDPKESERAGSRCGVNLIKALAKDE